LVFSRFQFEQNMYQQKNKTKSDEKITTVYERQYIVHNIQQYIIRKIESQIADSHSHKTKYPCSTSKLFFCQIACYSFNTQIFRGIITFIQVYILHNIFIDFYMGKKMIH